MASCSSSSAHDDRLRSLDDLSQRDFRIIIGSAHDYEEKYLIPALVDLMNLNSNLKVLYAPHEPFEIEIERIKSLFKENGFVAKIHRNKKNLSLPSDQLLILGVEVVGAQALGLLETQVA